MAANFPNFANKLPETKIPKRIVKVLTSSPTLAIFLRPSPPPLALPFTDLSLSHAEWQKQKLAKMRITYFAMLALCANEQILSPARLLARASITMARECFRGRRKRKPTVNFRSSRGHPLALSRVMKAANSATE